MRIIIHISTSDSEATATRAVLSSVRQELLIRGKTLVSDATPSEQQVDLVDVLASEREQAILAHCKTLYMFAPAWLSLLAAAQGRNLLQASLEKAGFSGEDTTLVLVHDPLSEYLRSQVVLDSVAPQTASDDLASMARLYASAVRGFFDFPAHRIAFAAPAFPGGALAAQILENVLHWEGEVPLMAFPTEPFPILSGALQRLASLRLRCDGDWLVSEADAEAGRQSMQRVLAAAGAQVAVADAFLQVERALRQSLRQPELALDEIAPELAYFMHRLKEEPSIKMAYEDVSLFLERQVQNSPPSSLLPVAPRTVSEVPTRYGLLSVISDDLISQFCSAYGEWSQLEVEFLAQQIPRGARIFDVGAFIGTFSLGIQSSKPGFILAVEPNPFSFEVLQGNLNRNAETEIATINCAVGTAEGLGQALLGDQRNLGTFTLAAAGPIEASSAIPVQTETLAGLREWYGPYDVLKLDVEGAETDVLKSDLPWLAAKQPMIWAECNEDSRSLILLQLLLDLGYEVHFYRYPAFNPSNFNGEIKRIFPVAYEAGLLACKPGTNVLCPPALEAAGATCERIHDAQGLRQALWLTARWGRPEWNNYSRAELLGLCSRLASSKNFSGFIGPALHPVVQEQGNQTLVETKVELKQVFKVPPSEQALEQFWNSRNIQELEASELVEGALYYERAAARSMKAHADEQSIMYRARTRQLLERWRELNGQMPGWMQDCHRRSLLEAAVACDRCGDRYKAVNEEKAARYWAEGAHLLEQQAGEYGLNEPWMKEKLNRQYLEGGIAYEKAAAPWKERAPERAALCWQQGASLLGGLVKNGEPLPEWVLSSLKKQLLEGGFAFDRAALALPESESALRSAYWQQGAALLAELAASFGSQPEWLTDNLAHQWLEGGIAADRAAAAARDAGDQAGAAHAWERGAELLGRLLAQRPEQPQWVRDYHRKQLLEGAFAYDRVAGALAEKQEDQLPLWRSGLALFDELQQLYPMSEEWIREGEARLLSGAFFSLQRVLQGLPSSDLTRHTYVVQGLACFVRLVSDHPGMWSKQRVRWLPAVQELTAQLQALGERDGPAALGEPAIEYGVAVLAKLMAQLPECDEAIVVRYGVLRNWQDALVPTGQAASLRAEFANMGAVLDGLVKLNLHVAGGMPDGLCKLDIVIDGASRHSTTVQLSTEGVGTTWVGLHTHLLDNQAHDADLSLMTMEGVPLARLHKTFEVRNDGALAEQVRQSLRRHQTPLFVGSCDSHCYDYTDAALVPWFDREDAPALLDAMRERNELTAEEYAAFAQFITEGYIVLEDLIDEDLLRDINAEVEHVVDTRYQGYEYGSSQRITLTHKVYPAIRRLLFDQRYLSVVDKLFQQPAQPCQSLLYVFGSQQDAHQDTVHLTPFPAGYMCGVWIALEDIQPESGELEIYPGTHRLPRRYMNDLGCAKVTDDWTEFGQKFVGRWRTDLESGGYEKIIYRPRKGTVLIWHENLMHAGGVRKDASLSRKSIVFHCFAKGAVNYYDSSGEVGMIER